MSAAPPPAVAAFDRLPDSMFPATVARGTPPERGVLSFRLSFLGRGLTLSAPAVSNSQGQVGTLTRTSNGFILRFTRLSYTVAPIKLPDGQTLASQRLTLTPALPSTLVIDRRTGAVTSDVHWTVNAPNALYNGSHTIGLADKGMRRFLSFKQVAPGRYSFNVQSRWHGSVVLGRWSVAGKSLPGGPVAMTGNWNGFYVLIAKH